MVKKQFTIHLSDGTTQVMESQSFSKMLFDLVSCNTPNMLDKIKTVENDALPAPAEDDKEYREWVETEALINLSEVLEKAQTDKWRGEQLNDSYLINSATKRIKYYTRLIADIKKGVGL